MPSTSFSHHKPCRATTSSISNSSPPVCSSAAGCSFSAPKQDSGGGGGSCEQSPRRLTRQRKLRHINNQDLGFYLPEKSYSLPTSPEYSTQKSRSPVRGSKSNHWSPQPLPLPESPVIRKPESAKNEFFGPRKVKGKAVTSSGSASPSSYSSQVATTSGGSAAAVSFYSNNRRGALSQDANNGGGSLSSYSSQVATTSGGSSAPVSSYSNNRRGALSQDANNGGGFFNNLGLNILSRKAQANGISSHPFSPQRSKTVDSYPIHVAPTSPVNSSSNRHRGTPHEYESCNMSRSAPTSAFSSPAVSPRRSNTAGDFFTSFGAPHDQNLDVFPPRLSPHRPAHSPSHSPTSRSPRFNQKSSNGNAFLLPSLERAESSGQVSAHPLPLPPPPQQSVMHHNAEALSLSSMKGQWQKGKLIGRGTFGSVYLATNRETGALCAMKEVDLIPDDPKAAECIKQLEQEIKVLRTLKHPNIVQYYGSEMTEDHFYIYLEYVHPGSINKYVQDHIGAMTESVVRNFTRHILSGLAFLHSTKTIHRDIKGANLLVDASGVVKLADFGVAKHLNGQSYNLSLKGSPYWMAPEVIRAAMQNSAAPDLALAVDIWSLGCTIVEMFNGKPPWNEFTGPQAMFKVLNTIPDIPETLSAEGKDFLHLCFRRNPAERPLACILLEHPFDKLDGPKDHINLKNGRISISPHL